eukprot:CAMPEP_0170602932 /NCGR_PEP_ID=MMETSP0224-20130122/18652_1 /TAXON_ID=285029 /ORGANISM="Togula jolla, Strain CCCM 725" /LENGTH=476 /DNA_ID=CAMNT_0010927799 /DNA_START=28 /DNA_END=1458 /DNA_ORIENTATION=-
MKSAALTLLFALSISSGGATVATNVDGHGTQHSQHSQRSHHHRGSRHLLARARAEAIEPEGSSGTRPISVPPQHKGAKAGGKPNLDATPKAEIDEYHPDMRGPFGGETGRRVVLVVLAVALLMVVMLALHARRAHGTRHDTWVDRVDHEDRSHKNLSDDIYGFAISSFVRDLHHIALGKGKVSLRISRLCLSVAILALNVGIQAFIISQVAKLAASKWVHNIRDDYDGYEVHMYGDAPGHLTMTVNGRHRGVVGFFNPANFETLDEDLKDRVCGIPFSQPAFFMTVLFIWTLTCIAEIRQCVMLFQSLVFTCPRIPSMASAFKSDIGEKEATPVEMTIIGLTRNVKVGLTCFIIIPRFAITFVLMWLGSRFLAATNDFSELVLNAVALEFVLMLKDLLYVTIVPERNKRDTANTLMVPSMQQEPASYWAFLGSCSWALVAMVWVMIYIFQLQSVLPDYRWDVNELCTPWLHETYSS